MNVLRSLRKGFTLIEMLVVIAIIALLASILVPAVNRALANANRTRMVANARGIYTSVFAEVTDIGNITYGGAELYPVSTAQADASTVVSFSNSTDYFVYLVTNEILSVDWNYFAARGIPSAPGRYIEGSPIEFEAENNAWSVVADLSDNDSGAPFIMSRNVDHSLLVEWTDPNSKVNLDDSDYDDDENVVVCRVGGGAEVLTERFRTWKNLNPGKRNNAILPPGTGSP